MSFIHLTAEWGPDGALAKGEQQLPPNSRSSEASRSEEGSSAANAPKPGGINGRGNAPTEDGANKKKRGPKFLAKQFGMITKHSNESPRRNLKLLGKEYVIAVPGSRALASTNDTASLGADSKIDDRDESAQADRPIDSVIAPAGSVAKQPPIEFVNASVDYKTEEQGVVAEQHRNVAKPPIEFVTAPIDYKTEKRGVVRGKRRIVADKPPIEFVTVAIDLKMEKRGDVRGEQPLDFMMERSPGISARVVPNSVSGSHSSSGRSASGSERLSFSHGGSPRTERSVLSIPETVMSSAEHRDSAGSLKSHSTSLKSHSTSLSSLAEWSSQSLERRGELSIAGMSLGEGRNVSGISRRTDITSAHSPVRSDTQALNYSPDDTDSGVEMYHETTSASPGSYSSRRSSCSLSEDWISEVEDSDGVSHHERRANHRSDASCSSYSSQFRSRYSPSSSTRNKGQPGCYDDRKRNDSSLANSSFPSRRHIQRHDEHARAGSKMVTHVGNHGNRRGRQIGTRCQSSDGDDTAILLDSITPQEAIAVFHDEVAQMMLEEGQDCAEAHDVEEFLDGYMRLRSPFYLSMVDEFFRAVCVDCYKRPVELPLEATPRTFNNRSGSFTTSTKSLRSESHAHNFKRVN